MARHLSRLRAFRLSTVQYDGWIELEHRWRECDWTEDITGRSLPAILRLATAHARVCDGERQPRIPRQPSVLGEQLARTWGPVIGHSLRTTLVGGEPRDRDHCTAGRA